MPPLQVLPIRMHGWSCPMVRTASAYNTVQDLGYVRERGALDLLANGAMGHVSYLGWLAFGLRLVSCPCLGPSGGGCVCVSGKPWFWTWPSAAHAIHMPTGGSFRHSERYFKARGESFYFFSWPFAPTLSKYCRCLTSRPNPSSCGRFSRWLSPPTRRCRPRPLVQHPRFYPNSRPTRRCYPYRRCEPLARSRSCVSCISATRYGTTRRPTLTLVRNSTWSGLRPQSAGVRNSSRP